MIDFIAQSEPVTALAPESAVNDQLRVHENDERENRVSFEELLAGVIHDDTPTTEFSNIEFADDVTLPIENVQMEMLEQLSVSALVNANADIKKDINTGIDPDIDLSDEDKNILLSVEHFFSRSLEAPSDSSEIPVGIPDDIDKILPVTPGEKANLFAELNPQSEISSVVKNAAEPDIAAHKTASGQASLHVQGEQNVKENISADNKKEQVLVKNENTEAHPSAIKADEKFAQAESDLSHNNQEDRGLLDEMRGRSRNDKIAFEIRDQRTMADVSNNTQINSFMSADTAAVGTSNASVSDITLELRLPDFNNAGQNAQTTWEGKAASAIENMLARELHQNFNGDIVRHASMALRDGGESTIKLALRPDNLGNVKIRLEMTENKITGFIIVESEEALNAFRKEIASLEQAFKDAGFADASLDLTFAGDGRNAWREQEADSFSSQMVASSYEESIQDAELDTAALIDVFLGRRTGSINMLA